MIGSNETIVSSVYPEEAMTASSLVHQGVCRFCKLFYLWKGTPSWLETPVCIHCKKRLSPRTFFEDSSWKTTRATPYYLTTKKN